MKVLIDKAPMEGKNCPCYNNGICHCYNHNHLCMVEQEIKKSKKCKDFNHAFRLGYCPYFSSITHTPAIYEDSHWT